MRKVHYFGNVSEFYFVSTNIKLKECILQFVCEKVRLKQVDSPEDRPSFCLWPIQNTTFNVKILNTTWHRKLQHEKDSSDPDMFVKYSTESVWWVLAHFQRCSSCSKYNTLSVYPSSRQDTLLRHTLYPVSAPAQCLATNPISDTPFYASILFVCVSVCLPIGLSVQFLAQP